MRGNDGNAPTARIPDGHKHLRRKWNGIIRKYWKYSESLAVKYADLVICDSKCIESYIKDEYAAFKPKTTFIAYGSDITPSTLADDDIKYQNWLINHNLKDREFYISVGRFVPENNFDIMIREFMASKTTKDFQLLRQKILSMNRNLIRNIIIKRIRG